MRIETIETNEVFRELLVLLRLHNDKDYICEMFSKIGYDVSKSKIKSWSTRSDSGRREYRAMPQSILRDFIRQLHAEKLVVEDEPGE